jgi:hypothetical protein
MPKINPWGRSSTIDPKMDKHHYLPLIILVDEDDVARLHSGLLSVERVIFTRVNRN